VVFFFYSGNALFVCFRLYVLKHSSRIACIIQENFALSVLLFFFLSSCSFALNMNENLQQGMYADSSLFWCVIH